MWSAPTVCSSACAVSSTNRQRISRPSRTASTHRCSRISHPLGVRDLRRPATLRGAGLAHQQTGTSLGAAEPFPQDLHGPAPRWGWRKAHAIARSEGLVTNRKRTRRLWRDERLKRPAAAAKKRRIGEGRNQRLTAERPDQMWALDFQTDATVDGRQVRFLNVIDEFTREALATRPFRSCTSDQLCAVLDEIIAVTKRWPEHIRMDNGTEMTAHAMTDWCRFTGVDAAFVDPGSPWQNGR